MRPAIGLVVILAVLASSMRAQEAGRTFTEDQARHLLNRAGFGGTPEEISALARMGLKDAVSYVLDGPKGAQEELPAFVPKPFEEIPFAKLRELDEEERRAFRRRRQMHVRQQTQAFRQWWADRMLTTSWPLQEKVTLFWHGYFTSSIRSVRSSEAMIHQNELLRREGLGNFRTLLREITRDPAMLRYLDNDRNMRGAPNENYAREVMELFTLGEGHYTEKDIKECARALTGWVNRRGRVRFVRRRHDGGEKTIFGRTGRFDTDDALDIILLQPQAPRWVAQRILHFFVGAELPEGMVDRYGKLLRKHDWDLKPFFRTLFMDRDFYRPEVMGNHILSPVEYLVGIGRRLGENPPGWIIVYFADQLGQRLLDPPNVKGWEGGEAWITTATFMQRGNFARYLIEGFDRRAIFKDFAMEKPEGEEPMMEPEAPGDRKKFREARRKAGRMMARQMGGMMRGLGNKSWRPETRMREIVLLSGARTAPQVVDTLCGRFLGVPVTDEARETLAAFLKKEAQGMKARFRNPTLPWSEDVLRRLVHLILSLPEAQLG